VLDFRSIVFGMPVFLAADPREYFLFLRTRTPHYLASIGIVKGQPFAPDKASKDLLVEAGAAMARMNAYGGKYPHAIVYLGKHWQWALRQLIPMVR